MSWLKRLTRQQKGNHFEQKAQTHYRQQGYRILETQYRIRGGEIDLIVYHPKRRTLRFVEVRYRQNQSHGGALASVTASKQQRIQRAALQYLQCHPSYAEQQMQFDVVAYDGEQMTWIENAW